MAILNYTTKINAEKTATEIQQMLGKSGAKSVMSEYEDCEVVAIAFQIDMNDQTLSFRLPINHTGVLTALRRDKCGFRYTNEAQAIRTAWRIVKDWVESQIALVDANQAELAEVFFPYLQDNNGTTIYSKLKQNKYKLLT